MRIMTKLLALMLALMLTACCGTGRGWGSAF